jgi:hippurate hydrolase
MTRIHAFAMLMAALAGHAMAADSSRDAGQVVPELTTIQPGLEALYRDLHQHPELSFHEVRTADALATRLKALGYEVTTGVGETGIVAILRNGPVRSSCCARARRLPVEEKRVAFASRETRNEAGEVPVAHACGHDLPWRAEAARSWQATRRWHGTLMLVSRPRNRRQGRAMRQRPVYEIPAGLCHLRDEICCNPGTSAITPCTFAPLPTPSK